VLQLPHILPVVQVRSELLLTSPSTASTVPPPSHQWVTPSMPSSPLRAMWASLTCSTGTWYRMGARCADHHWGVAAPPHHGGCLARALHTSTMPACTLAVGGSAPPVGRPWLVGCVTPGQAPLLVGLSRSATHCVRWPSLGFGPFAWGYMKSLFFSRINWIDSNFGNSYLFKYLSKSHETGSVGFIISISIKENIKLKSSIELNKFISFFCESKQLPLSMKTNITILSP
jgi:hypothetical protein